MMPDTSEFARIDIDLDDARDCINRVLQLVEQARDASDDQWDAIRYAAVHLSQARESVRLATEQLRPVSDEAQRDLDRLESLADAQLR